MNGGKAATLRTGRFLGVVDAAWGGPGGGFLLGRGDEACCWTAAWLERSGMESGLDVENCL